MICDVYFVKCSRLFEIIIPTNATAMQLLKLNIHPYSINISYTSQYQAGLGSIPSIALPLEYNLLLLHSFFTVTIIWGYGLLA